MVGSEPGMLPEALEEKGARELMNLINKGTCQHRNTVLVHLFLNLFYFILYIAGTVFISAG